MIASLLIAAPSAPEPGPNYLELVGIPLLVAVVTAVLTSALSNRRARADRLAALRLETYRELVILARRWQANLDASGAAEAEGEDITPYMDAWAAGADRLRDQMSVLPIVARKRSLTKIQGAFRKMTTAMLEIDTDEDLSEQKSLTDAADNAEQEFIDTVVEQARREIRRTRV